MWLEVSSEGAPARSLPLRDGSLTIGRGADCDLVVDDAFVSAHHARIDVRDGTASIADLSSRNGTYLDGELLVTMRRLDPGAEIQIGSAVLRVVAPPPAAPVSVAPAPVVDEAQRRKPS